MHLFFIYFHIHIFIHIFTFIRIYFYVIWIYFICINIFPIRLRLIWTTRCNSHGTWHLLNCQYLSLFAILLLEARRTSIAIVILSNCYYVFHTPSFILPCSLNQRIYIILWLSHMQINKNHLCVIYIHQFIMYHLKNKHNLFVEAFTTYFFIGMFSFLSLPFRWFKMLECERSGWRLRENGMRINISLFSLNIYN